MAKSKIFLYLNLVFLLLVFIFSFYNLSRHGGTSWVKYIFQEPKEIKKFTQLQKSLFELKSNFEKSINKTLPEPQASFLAGLTVGARRSLPEEFKEDLIKTGTIHLVALSGYNVTIIAQFVNLFFGTFLSRQISFWLAIIFITLFALMTGASASIVRAAIMGILVLIARRESRLYNVRNALIFSGSLMVFQNPQILIWDIGFQLSFLATLGLIYFTPFFEKRLGKITNFLNIKESLIATLSAQSAVLPFLLFYFSRLSLISPLANIFILPFVPFSMLLGFLIGVSSFIFLPLAHLFALPAWLLLTYKIKIIEILASLPYSSIKF